MAVDKFDEALEKLALADSKWVNARLKTEIETNLKLLKGIRDDKNSYDKGVEYYDNGKYEDAKQMFQKVSTFSKYYVEAGLKISSINEKLSEETKKKVQGAKIVNIVTPTPTSAPDQNLNQICENEMNIYTNTLENKTMAAVANNEKYRSVFGTPLQTALDAQIHRQVVSAGYQFFNDCLAGKKRLKDMTY
jgi:hypothetical protein